jgi:hypothetical protein
MAESFQNEYVMKVPQMNTTAWRMVSNMCEESERKTERKDPDDRHTSKQPGPFFFLCSYASEDGTAKPRTAKKVVGTRQPWCHSLPSCIASAFEVS